MMHKFIAFLLRRYTKFQVIGWDERGRIARIGIRKAFHPDVARIDQLNRKYWLPIQDMKPPVGW